jgi:hypothetical protein
MTNFKLISAAAILSAAIATPAFAQEAAQEPGLQAFYQSLGVGSRSSATASAMASARSGSNASVPVKRISAKHYTSDHKMWQGRANKSVPRPQKRRSIGPPFLQGPMWRSDTEWAAPFFSRQPTSIWAGFTVRPVEGEQYASVGLALLLHVQQNWQSFLPKLPRPDACSGWPGLERTDIWMLQLR